MTASGNHFVDVAVGDDDAAAADDDGVDESGAAEVEAADVADSYS